MRTFASEEAALQFLMDIPWGTAAGTSRDPRMIGRYAEAGARIVHYGSTTHEQRNGNAGDNFYYDPRTGNSVNAWGIPNGGIDAELPKMKEAREYANEGGAELWSSISAGAKFDALEYRSMTRRIFQEEAADVVAGNFSCPNIVVDGKPKPGVCYDSGAFEAGVQSMRAAAHNNRIAVKIAPITEPRILDDLVTICLKYEVDYIEVANTVPNCYMENEQGKPAIAMPRGGGAGAMLRPIVSGMIQMIKPQLAGTTTKVIAIGGVAKGQHAYDYLKLGADGFEFNTALSAQGGSPDIIHEIILGIGNGPGLMDLLVAHGLPD